MDKFGEWLLKPFLEKLPDAGLLLIIFFIVFAGIGAFIKILKLSAIKSPLIGVDFEKEPLEKTTTQEALPVKDETYCYKRKSLLNHQYFKFMDSALTPGFIQLNQDTNQISYKDAINLAFLRDCKFKVNK
jgi:hypothetical protein